MLDKEVKKQLKNQTTGYLTAALGLVAGLAWNEAIKALIDILFPFNKSGVLVKFIYAILITIIVVLLSNYLLKSINSKEE